MLSNPRASLTNFYLFVPVVDVPPPISFVTFRRSLIWTVQSSDRNANPHRTISAQELKAHSIPRKPVNFFVFGGTKLIRLTSSASELISFRWNREIYWFLSSRRSAIYGQLHCLRFSLIPSKTAVIANCHRSSAGFLACSSSWRRNFLYY